MIPREDIPLRPMYPDVLGAVTGGPRIYMEKLQCAVGVFPKQTFINQPFEVVLLFQNMVDQNMQLKVGIQLPTTDKKGNPVIVDIAKKTIALGLTPGEVGVLHVPVVAHPPTHPGRGFPIRVAIRYRTPNPGVPVRPPGGGPPPSVLSISPFKLQALRDVEFAAHTWNESAEIITTYFDIVPNRIPHKPQDLKGRYETLWANQQMLREMELVQAQVPKALALTTNRANYSSSYPALLRAVEERFAARELPLHPGEAKAIAKIMAYTVDEAPHLETYLRIEETRWFQTFCQVLANDEVAKMDRNDILAKYVFEAILYDAILMAFTILRGRVKEDLGTQDEQISYATSVLAWMAGYGQPDLNYIYLPLIMGGVAVNRLVMNSTLESPWELLEELREASQGRIRLVSGETVVVFDILDKLLTESEGQLRLQRIKR